MLENDILSFSSDSGGEQQSKWSSRSSRLIEMEDLWTAREKIQFALFKYGVVVESAPAVEDTATPFIGKMSLRVVLFTVFPVQQVSHIKKNI